MVELTERSDGGIVTRFLTTKLDTRWLATEGVSTARISTHSLDCKGIRESRIRGLCICHTGLADLRLDDRPSQCEWIMGYLLPLYCGVNPL
jgi:hypothetical protein